ncbi:hypothetical protein SUDANB145_05608 [Streptomyces sp. enrichment culture]
MRRGPADPRTIHPTYGPGSERDLTAGTAGRAS